MLRNKSKKRVVKKLKSIAVVSAFLGLLKKNFKLILRSRSSATVFLLGPLIIIFLVSAAFNTTSLFNIKIGAYSDSYSELSESLLQELGQKQFIIEKFSSKEKCIDDLKNNLVHVCAVIPSNLQAGSSENIEFFVDNSKVNLVWIIIDAVSKRVTTKSTELSQILANNLLTTLSNTNEKLSQKAPVLNSIVTSSKDLETKFTQISASLDALDFSFTVGISGKVAI